MIDINIADRYSLALFEIAEEKKQLKIVLKEFEKILDIFYNNDLLFKIFESKNIIDKEKIIIINYILDKQNISKILKNFFLIIFENNREKNIKSIYESYLNRYQRYENIKIGYFTTSIETNEKEKEILEKKFSEIFKCKIILKIKINKELIGGAILELDGKYYEDSIKSRINCFEKYLKG